MSDIIKAHRKELMETLYENVLEVTFTKINGDTRVMECTLIPSMLPPKEESRPAPLAALSPFEPATAEVKKKKVNEETVSVWDLKAKGWRSFRVANVTSTEVVVLTS